MVNAVRARADSRTLSRYFRVLGDPTRLRIIELLAGGERTVGEIVEELAISQPRASTHLACLRHCRFVAAQRRGREVLYELAIGGLPDLLDAARESASGEAEHLASCRRVGPDWA